MTHSTLKPYVISLFLFLSFGLTKAQKFWLTTYEFPNGPKTGIVQANDSSLFAGYLSGVLRSFNGGERFEESLRTTAVFSVFSSKSGDVLAGGSGKIFRTSNLGQSWDSVSLNSVFPVTQFAENAQGDLFAITGTIDLENGFVGDGIFFSNDKGKTWEQRNSGLGIYKSCERIAVDKYGRLYLTAADEYATGKGGLFISDDNGLQWQHVDIRVDGKNVIPDDQSIVYTTGLSISPKDSLYLSFNGIAYNILVQMNIRKSLSDITRSNSWQPYNISNTNNWWYDRLMGNIHFARNGDQYSSAAGSMTQGGTFFRKSGDANWQRIDFGLGLDMNGERNFQYFAEDSSGKIYMIQMLDERIYWTDKSLFTSVPEKNHFPEISVFPNPIKPGEILTIHNEKYPCSYTLMDLSGKIVQKTVVVKTDFYLQCPKIPGIYLLVAENEHMKTTSKVVIR